MKISTLLTLLTATLLPLHAATVIFQFQDNFGRAATPAVSLTPLSVPLIQSNTIVLSGLTTFRWPTNGIAVDSWGNTNFWGWTNGQLVLPLSAGGYTVQASSWPRAWSLTVPVSTNTFYAADLSSNTLILGPQTIVNNYAAGLLTNAIATNAPGVFVTNGVIVISTNYDLLGAAAGVQAAIQSQFYNLTNGFVDRSVTNAALNRLAQNDGSGLTGLNAGIATNAAAGGNIMTTDSAPILGLDTNALYFANTMGISDMQTRADLIGMMNEIQSSVLSNNVVALHSFLPRFNPGGNTNGIFTIVGHYPIAFSNSTGGIFSHYGFVLTNSQALIYNLPNCITNTQIYAWSCQMDGNSPPAYFGGLANSKTDQMLALTAGGPNTPTFRIRAGGVENASTGNNEQAGWLMHYELGNWNWPRDESRWAAGNILVTGLAYDGSNLSAFEDFCQQKIDYNNPTFRTNYATVGIQITAPLTNLILGAEGYTNISTLKNAQATCAGFMILNTPITNIMQWKAAYRIMMWMYPDQNYIFAVGDSTMGFGGNLEPNNQCATNSPWVAFKNSNQFSNSLMVQCYAIGADALEHYFPWGQDGALCSNDLAKFDSGFLPANKFRTRECIYSFGLNDIFGITSYSAQYQTNLTSLAAICSSNNILLDLLTVRNCFSNSNYGSGVQPNAEIWRLNCNAFITSNAWNFHRIIRDDMLVTQHTMDTNPLTGPGFSQATDGGIHLGGPNGWFKSVQIANLMLGIAQPVQSDATVISPGGSPFYWTNLYSCPVTFTWSGGNISAITNSVTIPSASGETIVPAGGIVSVVYTGNPILDWYYTPGIISP